MVLSIGFLLLVSLVLSAVVAATGNGLSAMLHISVPGLNLASSAISFLLITVLFALIFKILPDARVEWKDVWVGGLVTSALFAVGRYFIGLYLGHSAVASAYGASGSLVVLMLWTYYSALIFFFGAELTRAYAYHFGSKRNQPAISSRGNGSGVGGGRRAARQY
jgi:membrane protein